MILEFIDKFQEVKDNLRKSFLDNPPSHYGDILYRTLGMIFADIAHYTPDFDKIHTIDDGDYQGTILYIIPERTYQPSKYWAVKVSYGSCSGCDTFQANAENDAEDRADGEVTMALHMIQSMKEI